MALAGKKGQVGGIFAGIGDTFSRFFSFVGTKLGNYPSLSLGEQISYAAIGLGILLLLISLVMAIL